MRSEWNVIAIPLLYTHVLTDSLPGLVAEMDKPSKRRSLAHTRSLRIEYLAKEHHNTYLEVMSKRGQWERHGLGGEALLESLFEQCREEREELDQALANMLHIRGSINLFPKLEPVAVGSVYEDKSGVWAALETAEESTAHGPMPPWRQSCLSFDSFVHTHRLKHVCVRNPSGPLTFDRTDYAGGWSNQPPPYLRTVHFNETDTSIPLSYGLPTRWISDIRSDDPWVESIPLPVP